MDLDCDKKEKQGAKHNISVSSLLSLFVLLLFSYLR